MLTGSLIQWLVHALGQGWCQSQQFCAASLQQMSSSELGVNHEAMHLFCQFDAFFQALDY